MAKIEKPDILANKTIDWLNTDEGKKVLEESMKRAEKTIEELKKERQIDWRSLHTPIGPADGSGVW